MKSEMILIKSAIRFSTHSTQTFYLLSTNNMAATAAAIQRKKILLKTGNYF